MLGLIVVIIVVTNYNNRKCAKQCGGGNSTDCKTASLDSKPFPMTG